MNWCPPGLVMRAMRLRIPAENAIEIARANLEMGAVVVADVTERRIGKHGPFVIS
jgi:hypothetical protein